MSEEYARLALRPVVDILKAAGFWAYLLFGDNNQWLVACDTEFGRVDVRIGADGYVVEVWNVSPGLFFDEEDVGHRTMKERVAHLTLARPKETLRQAPLTLTEEYLSDAWWDEQEHGVGARLRREVPFSAGPALPQIISHMLHEMNTLLGELEERPLSEGRARW